MLINACQISTFVFPDSRDTSYETSGRNNNKQYISSEIISNRPNSDFNRLTHNRISHSLQINNQNSDETIDFIDDPEKLTNDYSFSPPLRKQDSSTVLNNNIDYNKKLDKIKTEARHFIYVHHKKKKKHKKRCKTKLEKTHINFIYADINYNGIGCGQNYITSGGGGGGVISNVIHGGGGGGSSTIYGSAEGTDDTSEEEDYNDHGSLVGAIFNKPQISQPVSAGVSQGSYVNQGSQSSGVSHGGPLGFFGQGGLFDFFGGGGGGGGGSFGNIGNLNRPQVDEAIYNSDSKPVIEINVPDTVQDVVT